MAEAVVDLMVGRPKPYAHEEPSDDEKELFNDSFSRKAEELKLIDVDIYNSFMNARPFYDHALGVSKAVLGVPYGGDRCNSGQFGDTFIRPYDLSMSQDTEFDTWVKTIASAGWQALWGSSADPIEPSITAMQKAVHAFHKLIAYGPSPSIQQMAWNVNKFTYPTISVEPFSKISKPEKVIKLIPMPGQVLVLPGGSYFVRMACEKVGTIEVAPLGLVFAEYKYLYSEQY